MRHIGFSTGALALADFRAALKILAILPLDAVELSALREHELFPLLDSFDDLDLRQFRYVSIHAPSQIGRKFEAAAAVRLAGFAARGFPIIVHPDAISDWDLWIPMGRMLCIENMDKRKPIGRTADELERIFKRVPTASFCFDIGHARQIDPTMNEAWRILTEFGSRLSQVHVSEVGTSSRHDRLSFASKIAFQQVAHLIPETVPLILETPATADTAMDEVREVSAALPESTQQAA
jgi:hypothetical protein